MVIAVRGLRHAAITCRLPNNKLWLVTWLWGLVAVIGLGMLWGYAARPGATTTPPQRWPTESGLSQTPGYWTLVMFVHPRCPCTRASLAELERLQTRLNGLMEVYLISLRFSRDGADEAAARLSRRAASWPDTRFFVDETGGLIQAFGAGTSGEVCLYDPTGRLAYHGGLTIARGHEGESPGGRALAALVRGNGPPKSSVVTGPTFGCSLGEVRPQDLRVEEPPR